MAAFTDKFVRGLKPSAKRYEERDAGCPGLAIRVGVRGEKQWSVIAAQNGKRRRIRLGVYPDISLAMARRRAAEIKAAPSLHTGSLRLRDLWERYSREKAPSRRSFADVESVWRNWAAERIGDVRLEDLSMRHGADLVEYVAARSSSARARKVIRYLSPMLAYAAGRGLILGNPWTGLHLPEDVAPRDRVLSHNEWSSIWRWAVSEPYPFGPWLRALMLSAQRLSEVAGMRWDEIEDDVWVIPAKRHKSKRRHEVPLSDALAQLIADQPRHDEFVFSTRVGKPIAPGSKLKMRIANAIAQQQSGTPDMPDWRFHDVRRTAATIMGESDVSRFIIERVLGHTDQSVTAIYDRATYREDKRRALEVLAKTIGEQ